MIYAELRAEASEALAIYEDRPVPEEMHETNREIGHA